MPYMLDLFLFLGREPKDKIPEEGAYVESDVYYGKFVQRTIDEENEVVKNLLQTYVDLASLYNVTENAYKLYHKTRPKPSPESVKRAKDLPVMNIHPFLCKYHLFLLY